MKTRLEPCAGALLLLTSLQAGSQEPLPAQVSLNTQAAVRQWVFDAMAPANAATRERLYGQVEAMTGREDLRAPARRDRPTCNPLQQDPLEVIAEEAKKTSIVIIGESHASPQDRHFIGEVLRVLRRQGFDVYAAETFVHGQLDHTGTSGGDGWYSNEPIFGRTISTARSLGYRLVAYEQTEAEEKARAAVKPDESAIHRREWNQTRNLMDRIFTSAPESRVIIHVGGQHGDERSGPNREGTDPWMAERLKIATGIDPLTIKQSACTSPRSTTVASRIRPDADGTAADWRPVDLYVGHPKLMLRNARPAWRQEAGDRILPMPEVFIGLDEPIMVEARAGMGDDSLASVPVDRVLLFPGERLPLLLPPGRYRIDGFIRGGRLPQDPVNVDVR